MAYKPRVYTEEILARPDSHVWYTIKVYWLTSIKPCAILLARGRQDVIDQINGWKRRHPKMVAGARIEVLPDAPCKEPQPEPESGRFETWTTKDGTTVQVVDMSITHLAKAWMFVNRAGKRHKDDANALFVAEATDPNEMYNADGDALPLLRKASIADAWCDRFAEEIYARGYTMVKDFRGQWQLVKKENLNV